MLHRFGPFELDENLYELRRAGSALRVRRRSFEVLKLLIDERHRVVSKEEILDRVWERRYVSQSALANCISELRSVLGGEEAARDIIRTVYGRGYRFVAALEGALPEETRPAPRPAARAETDSPRDTFVGRTRELARLETALDAMLRGRSQIALLLGEAGIGKTATALRLVTAARQRGVRILEGTCSDSGATPIGWPWVRILRAILGEHPAQRCAELLGDAAHDLATLLPELRHAREPVAPSDDGLPPPQLFESASRVIEHAASLEPLLIVLDDVHAADATSLQLLGFLANELRDSPVLLLCTLQPPPRPRHSPLLRVLSDLSRHPSALTLELPPLSRDEIGRLVEDSGSERVTPKLAERIFERSEGNPLFAIQLVRLIEDQPEAGAADEVALPPGLCATVALRLERLSPGCRELLGVASAIGRDFRAQLLQRAAELGPRECLDLLQEAIDARLIEETTGPGAAGGFRFRHGLLQAAVYQSLAAGERAEIHRTLGVALRGSDPRVPGALTGELAHHYYQSHDPALVGEAIELGERAARYAARHLAYHRAIEHYTRALAAAIELGLESRRICDLQIALAFELRRSVQFARADEMLGLVRERARSIGAWDKLTGAAIVWNGSDNFGTADPEVISLIEEALAHVPADNDSLRASLLLTLVSQRYAIDPPELSESRLREVLAIAERHQARTLQVMGVSLLYGRVVPPGRSAQIRSTVERYLRSGLEHSDRGVRRNVASTLVYHRVEWLDMASDATDGSSAEARKASVLGSNIVLDLLAGRVEDAEHGIEAIWRDWLPPIHGRLPLPLGAQLFALRRDQGRLAELEPVFDAVLARTPDMNLWRIARTLLLAETGRRGEACDAFHSLARKDFAKVPRNALWLGSAICLADACVLLGEKDAARTLYRELAPFADRAGLFAGLACAGPVSLALGRLATLCGEVEAAEAHLLSAAAVTDRLKWRSFALRTRLARAVLAEASGRGSSARQMRAPALAEARELGLHGLESV